MAQHTFITDIDFTKFKLFGYGVLTDWEYYNETIDVPSKSDIRKLIAKETGQISHDIGLQNRKLAKAVEQAKAAAKDAAEAKETVERLVEMARETFRDVIAELLEPHYRLLAQHLGIELPTAAAKLKVVEEKLPASARNTTKPDSAGSHRAEGTEKMRRDAGVKASKKKSTTKATATVRRTKTKGAWSCPKK